MKKIFLFALISTIAIATQAQWHDDRDGQHRGPYTDNRFDRSGNYSSRDRINQQFDQRIASVQFDRFLSHRQRRRQVRELEQQRRRALSDLRHNHFNHDGRYGYQQYPDHGRSRW